MTKLDQLLASPFWHDTDPAVLECLHKMMEQVRFDAGDYLAKQHHPAADFYLLVEGEVEFLIQVEDGMEQLSVGSLHAPWTPLGWSGLRPPHRFATDIRCLRTCTLLHWPYRELINLCDRYPVFGTRFHGWVLATGGALLEQTRNLLDCSPHSDYDPVAGLAREDTLDYPADRPELFERLRSSPFFEMLGEEALRRLLPLAVLREYRRGERCFAQGETADGFFLLESGAVALYFSSGERTLPLRTLFSPGQVIDWSGVIPDRGHAFAAAAVRDCLLYFFPQTALEALIDAHPDFGLALARRLIWLMGNHLRTLRVRIIAQRYDRERLAVRNLLQQAGSQLRVRSALHKVPHLLADRLTLDDAFTCLEQTRSQGQALERSLAGLCLDILQATERERAFFHALQTVYEAVVTAAPEHTPVQVRRACAEAFVAAFAHTRHNIQGWEHLPDQANHIFILNHLANHPFNTLSNGFQLTLDSHFLSAMILYRRYGDPGVRVVRRGRGEEYGHQDYYDRLGHIYVHTGESGPRSKDKGHTRFYDEAAEQLQAGHSLIICPEGTSRPSRESPGPFKPGAFRLAAALDPEPLIVPVTAVNFDRRIRHATLTTIIHPPFRVSEQVDVSQSEQLKPWLMKLSDFFKESVRGVLNLTENG